MSTPAGLAVAVLGAGALGAAVAGRLGEVGFDVRLWNRTSERALAAVKASTGVRAEAQLANALSGARLVITLLRDGDAVMKVIDEALALFDDGAVWVQMSTVGPDAATRLATLAEERHVAYLDAPVSGSTGPALAGQLVFLVSGEEAARRAASPLFEALGQAVVEVGGRGGASALKVVLNAWMAATTVALSDVLGLADDLGVGHDDFARAVGAGPLAMPYATAKLTAMDARSYPLGFAVELALKDLDLAEGHGASSDLLDAVHERLTETVADGYGRDDLAAVDHRRTERPSPVS